MAKYRVWAQSIEDVYIDVEADSPEEAIEIAEEADEEDWSSREDWINGDFCVCRNIDMIDVLEED